MFLLQRIDLANFKLVGTPIIPRTPDASPCAWAWLQEPDVSRKAHREYLDALDRISSKPLKPLTPLKTIAYENVRTVLETIQEEIEEVTDALDRMTTPPPKKLLACPPGAPRKRPCYRRRLSFASAPEMNY